MTIIHSRHRPARNRKKVPTLLEVAKGGDSYAGDESRKIERMTLRRDRAAFFIMGCLVGQYSFENEDGRMKTREQFRDQMRHLADASVEAADLLISMLDHKKVIT